MSFWKKLLYVVLIFFAILLVPAFLYGLLANGDMPTSLVAARYILAFLFLIGAIIYLAVDLAMRQNRR